VPSEILRRSVSQLAHQSPKVSRGATAGAPFFTSARNSMRASCAALADEKPRLLVRLALKNHSVLPPASY
jgi:hypothetical protein